MYRFQHLDSVVEPKTDKFILFGRCSGENGKSIAVHVIDVHPHVTICANQLPLCYRTRVVFEDFLNTNLRFLKASRQVIWEKKRSERNVTNIEFAKQNKADKLLEVVASRGQDILQYNEADTSVFFKIIVESKRTLFMLKQILAYNTVEVIEHQRWVKEDVNGNSIEKNFPLKKHVPDWNYGYKHACRSRYVRIGFGRPLTVYNDQVNFMLQYFIDKDIYSCAWLEASGDPVVCKKTSCDIEIDAVLLKQSENQAGVADWKIFSYDIESLPPPHPTVKDKYKFPDAKNDPAITIGGVLQTGAEITQYVWVLRRVGAPCERLRPLDEGEYRSEITQVFDFNNEQRMLKHFFKWCVETGIDILQGHNINRFDNKYLLTRYTKKCVWGRLIDETSKIEEKSFTSSQKGTYMQYRLHIPGVVVIDSYDIMKDQHNEGSYKLDDLAQSFLGTKKVPMDYNMINPKYKTLQGRHDLAVYCVKDAWLVYKLMDKLCKQTVLLQMSNVTGISINDVIYRGQGIRTIALMLRFAKRRNLMLPARGNKPRVQKRKRNTLSGVVEEEVDVKETFEGAVVVTPTPGLYIDEVVSCLDFASLYPSIMQAMNMSYETLCYRDKITRLGWKQDIDIRTVPDYEIINGVLQTTINLDNPSFVVKEKRLGLLPEILQKVLAERKAVKKLMKKQTPHSTMYKVYDGRQLGLKVVANSIYGFTGATFGYLPCKAIAESVTKFGRGMILQTKSTVENHPTWGVDGHGCSCIYGDSVTGNTPLLIKSHGTIRILSIRDLHEQHPFSSAVYTWTERGWTEIQNVVKHTLLKHKKIIRVDTLMGTVSCTDDHSLLTLKGEPITPDRINKGTKLMHSYPTLFKEPTCHTYIPYDGTLVPLNADLARVMGFFMVNGDIGNNTWQITHSEQIKIDMYKQICDKISQVMNKCVIGKRECWSKRVIFKINKSGDQFRLQNQNEQFIKFWTKLFYRSGAIKVPDVILNASSIVRRAFLHGIQSAQTVMRCYEFKFTSDVVAAGVYYLMRSIGYHVAVIPDKNAVRLSTMLSLDMDAVQQLVTLPYEEFVYDLTTENHHFHAGVGNIIVHNTDSVFIKIPRTLVNGDNDIQLMNNAHVLGEKMAQEITHMFLHPNELEYEKSYSVFLLLCKKRYVGMKYEPGLPPKIQMKGIECVRRDFAPIVVDTQKKILQAIIVEKNIPKAIEIVQRVVADFYANKIPLEMLIMSKKLSRPPEQYKAKAPHVELTKRRIAQGKEYAVAGDRVPYVIVYGGGGISDRACSPEDIQDGLFNIDRTYYLQKQFMPPMIRIFNKVVDNADSLFKCNSTLTKDSISTNSVFSKFKKVGTVGTVEDKKIGTKQTTVEDKKIGEHKKQRTIADFFK